VLSGTPTTPGSYSPTFTVTDSGVNIKSVTFTLTINPAALTITTTSLPSGVINVAYPSTTLQATGGKTPYTWSATGLPTGLSINTTTGVLSGTPIQSGTFSVVATVKDSSSPVLAVSQTYSLTIVASLTISTSSLPSGAINVAYLSTTLQAAGGKTPYSWGATGLPVGLSISSTTGLLSGAPTQSGTFNVVVTVKDSSSPVLTASQTYPLTIVGGLTIATTSLPNGTINVAYPATSLQASGGIAPYSWAATGLPTGLSLNATTAVLSGTPTQAGTFSVVVTVKDSSSPVATMSQTYSLTIAAGFTITTTSLPNGTVNAAYPSTTLLASGGKTPYTWTATGLPTGLSLNATTGVLSGTSTQSGTFSVVVTVKDSSSPVLTASQTYSLAIAAALTITTTSLPSGTTNAVYPLTTLLASGGKSPYTWTATGLPTGLGINSATGVLSGTPTSPGSFSVVVTVSDSSSPALTASQTYSLTIVVQPVQGITITQSASVSAPNQTSLLVSFGQAAQSAYTGTLSLSFQHDPSVTNVPANYVDPAGGFPVSGQSTSLVQNFTVSQGTTQSSIQVGLGTVAGTWTVTMTALTTGGASALPSPAPTYTVTVALAAPSIMAGSVQIVNPSLSGFSVVLTGFATTRDVASGMFTFTAASGAQLQGTTVTTVSFNGLDQSEWFGTTAGQSAGGTFSLTVPFGYSGDTSALGGVTVTLTDSKGQTSTAVSGT
jgi:drug/metabolite transporter superfamily protein YnfA